MGLSGAFRKSTLPNGLRVVSEQIRTVRSVSLGVWVEVGSRDETEAERGICHFLEHMLFKGTRKRSVFDIALSLESLGGSLDAFTCRDLTCFYARCLDEHAETALDVVADMLQNSQLAHSEIEKEKWVVLEEIQNVEDTPEDLIHDLFAKSVWGQHPVGAPILGIPETVKAFTQKDLQRYLHGNYRPENMVISVAGNLEHSQLVDWVGRLFGSEGGRARPCRRREKPRRVGQSVGHFHRDIGQTHICMGTAAYAYTHPQRYELLVASTVLGGGMSSRLFQRIRERLGLAYAVYSYIEMLEDTGLFGTYLACDRTRVEQSIEAVGKEFGRLRMGGVSREELARAKAQLRGELILGLESMDTRMNRMAWEEIYTGGYHPPEDSLAGMDRVTREGVLEASLGLLDEESMHVITVGP